MVLESIYFYSKTEILDLFAYLFIFKSTLKFFQLILEKIAHVQESYFSIITYSFSGTLFCISEKYNSA